MYSKGSNSSEEDKIKSHIGQWRSKPEKVKNHFLNLSKTTSNSLDNIAVASPTSGCSTPPTTPQSPKEFTGQRSSSQEGFQSRRTIDFPLFGSIISHQRQRTTSLCSPDELIRSKQNQNNLRINNDPKTAFTTTNLLSRHVVDHGDRPQHSTLTSSIKDLLEAEKGVRKRSTSFTELSAEFYD